MPFRYDKSMKFRWGLLAICFVFTALCTPALAISTPQEALTEFERIQRDFEDSIENPAAMEPKTLAKLFRRLNSLSLYLWDQAAGEVELALPESRASQKLVQVLAATSILQSILSLAMVPTEQIQDDKLKLAEKALMEGLTQKFSDLALSLETKP